MADEVDLEDIADDIRATMSAETEPTPTKKEADAIKRKLREGRGQKYKKGGRVRGAGIARKGTRKCKMR